MSFSPSLTELHDRSSVVGNAGVMRFSGDVDMQASTLDTEFRNDGL